MSERKRRPDLEAQTVAYPDYIGQRIMPYLGVPTNTGLLKYEKYTEDIVAQTGRDTANLAAITSHTVVSTKYTYTCTEVRGRVKMSYSEIAGYKDQDTADLLLGRKAKRAFYNALEVNIAKIMLNGTNEDVSSDPASGIEIAANVLRDKRIGKIGLAMADSVFVKLKVNEGIRQRLANVFVPIRDIENGVITPAAMASALGVNEVLIGADSLWNCDEITAPSQCAALFVIPNENEDPEEAAQLGRTVYYEFDGADSRFVVESYHDDDADAEVVDAKGLVDSVVLNEALKAGLQVL